jgi:hypothetical protein
MFHTANNHPREFAGRPTTDASKQRRTLMSAMPAVCALVIAICVANFGAAPTEARANNSNASQETIWWWTAQYAANTLVQNGIRWDTINRTDAILSDHCWGTGEQQDGAPRYRHLYCTVRPNHDRPYGVILAPTSQSTAQVSFDHYLVSPGLVKETTWYWGAQLVANSLVRNGIIWPRPTGQNSATWTDGISRDICTSFGPRYVGKYQHFYCVVDSSRGNRYSILVHVTGHWTYRASYVRSDSAVASPATGQQQATVTSADVAVLHMTNEAANYSSQMRYGMDFPPTCPMCGP